MKTMIEIGIMGGTFNPMHIRELAVAQFALEQHGLAKVIFVPNGTPPHKKVDVLDRENRFEMVKAGVRDNPLFEASRIEIDRPGITWTIDTLKQLNAQLGENVRLNFICGEDVIDNLVRYDRRAEFLGLVRLLISPRASEDAQKALATWRETLPEAQIELIDCPPSGISSTLVRKWIRAGKSIRYVVPAAVAEILERKGHYKVEIPAETSGEVATCGRSVFVTSMKVGGRKRPLAGK
jgi:nicotinate-nucleotide adenylyltransferase